jgi:undecaprenyl diphosphate synthase
VDFVQWCMEEGLTMLTVYAFSTENWRRDPKASAREAFSDCVLTGCRRSPR